MALVEACSAAVGTAIATLVFYPVDLVKTRVQAQVRDTAAAEGAQAPQGASAVVREILQQEGARGLYQGLFQYLVKDIINVASLFFLKQSVTDLYKKWVNAQLSIPEGLLLGMLGGGINQCLMLPTDRIMVRIQVDTSHPSVWQVVRCILDEGGLGAFWTGLTPSLLLTCNPAITFTAFDTLKQKAAPVLGKTAATLSILQTFLLASVAKTIALVLTYPLIRAKVVMLSRLRENSSDVATSSDHRPRRPGLAYMLGTLSEILTKEGPSGLYRGFSAQFWLSILSSGMLLMVKDQIMALVQAALSRAPPALAGP